MNEQANHQVREPASLLVDHLQLLPKGRVLDLAMGRGRNALYLAEKGFTVEGLDSSEESVQWCREEASRRKLSIDVRVVDLTRVHISPGSYEVVLCFYYLERTLIPQIKAALRPGGMLLYETFLIDQHLKLGKPRHREYCLEWNELLRSFAELRILYYREGVAEDGKAVASLVAQNRLQPVACRGVGRSEEPVGAKKRRAEARMRQDSSSITAVVKIDYRQRC